MCCARDFRMNKSEFSFFAPCQYHEKHCTFKILNGTGMPRFDKVSREWAIGMLDAGLSQMEVAQRFGVHQTTINRLVGCLRITRTTDDQPRSGRPRVTSHIQDRYIRIRHLRNWFLTAESTAAGLPFPCRIRSRTVLCRLAAV